SAMACRCCTPSSWWRTDVASAKITLPVTGMHCAACQSRVQSALAGVPGVRDASVSLMMNSATVTYDDGAVRPDQLIDTIKSTGYGASLPAAGMSPLEAQEREDAERQREVRVLTTKTVVSLAVATVAMVLPMLAPTATWVPWLLLV